MSFRLFVYYCALIGAWTGVIAWGLSEFVVGHLELEASYPVLRDGVFGMFLGLFVALGLGFVDALWTVGFRRFGQLFLRISLALALGTIGGAIGGLLSRWMFGVAVSLIGTGVPVSVFLVFGWTITGLAAGAAVGAFDFGSKLKKCVIGGGIGGFVGGLLAYLLRETWTGLFADKDATLLWSPTAIGFVTLGLFIGLLVGLAQVVLKEAWIKVEAGFRPGRELILTKPKTVIGRAEGSDIPLFGDQGVEKTHAQIVLEGVRYLVEDANSPGGTFVNEKRVSGRMALRSGDLIRVGKSVLRFNERKKR